MAQILVVDRDEAVAEAMAEVLTQAGHACAWLSDSDLALALLKWRWLDLVLLDQGLTGLSGAQVLRELRNSAMNHDTPVIMTGENPGGEGADAYLIKPFERRDLLRKVNLTLDAPAERPRHRARA